VSEPNWNRVYRTVDRAAQRISNELEELIAKLPEWAAPQMAMALLALEITRRQPTLVHWLTQTEEAKEGLAHLPLEKILEARRTRKARLNASPSAPTPKPKAKSKSKGRK
jgi:hypothetical protein